MYASLGLRFFVLFSVFVTALNMEVKGHEVDSESVELDNRQGQLSSVGKIGGRIPLAKRWIFQSKVKCRRGVCQYTSTTRPTTTTPRRYYWPSYQVPTPKPGGIRVGFNTPYSFYRLTSTTPAPIQRTRCVNGNLVTDSHGTNFFCFAVNCTINIGTRQSRRDINDNFTSGTMKSQAASQFETTSNGSTLVEPSSQFELVVAKVEYESLKVFRQLFNEKVHKAELYRIPLSILGKNASEEELIEGVIITLSHGRRFMITHGKEIFGGEELSALLNVADLTDNWEFIKSKRIHFSIVSDYVQTSDSCPNSKVAAEKMMKLD